MKTAKQGSRLDNIGMTASALCAVHCAIVPLLITSLPLFGLGFLANPWIEWSMIFFALFIGIYAIGLSYRRNHHRLLPVVLLIIGFTIIVAGHMFIKTWHEAIIVPIGGLFIVTAHFFNFKYSAMCNAGRPWYELKHHHAKG